MASQQVVVRVVNGDSTVEEAIRRPVRLTPDGHAGVAYAGSVYPLFADSRIDIAGPSWEMADCNRFLFYGAEIPYAPGESQPAPRFLGFDGEWAIESNSFGHYVVFNAPERVATEVVDTMESAGVSIQRWDVSHRPSSDGNFYDWFARLRFKGTHSEALSLVASVFSPQQAADSQADVVETSPPAPTRLEELEAQVEVLLGEIADLRDRVVEAEAESAMLRERLTAANSRESKLSGDLDRALDHQKSLHDQIAELGRSADESTAAKVLLAQQSETEEFLEFALAENAELRRSLTAVRGQAEQADSRIVTLEANISAIQQHLDEVVELERERRRASQTRRAPRRGVIGFLDTAFARLEFVLDSVEVIADLDAPASIIRTLVQVDMGENLGKDLEGLRSWREVSNLATGIAGSGSMGRIYYKPDGNRVLVSVHVKQDDKEQRRHIEKLRTV